MKFTPKYNVSYKGVFYGAGVTFNIDAVDHEEMSKHGVVKNSKTTVPAADDKPPVAKKRTVKKES